jgi:hypothetical protein
MLNITVSDIRTNFPEYSSSDVYPDSLIQFCIDVADLWFMELKAITDQNWITKLGLYLTAHHVFIKKQPEKGDMTNLMPIISTGLDSSSTGYQPYEGLSKIENTLSSTSYGQNFLMLLRSWRIFNVGAGIIANG